VPALLVLGNPVLSQDIKSLCRIIKPDSILKKFVKHPLTMRRVVPLQHSGRVGSTCGVERSFNFSHEMAITSTFGDS
jgi:hypothetical protein